MKNLIIVLVLGVVLSGCAANSHLQKVGPDTYRYDWEIYWKKEPRISVAAYKEWEGITEETWSLRRDPSVFAVIPGHPKFDGYVSSVKIWLDNQGPLYPKKDGGGYFFSVTSGWAHRGDLFRNVTPGLHTIVVEIVWTAWKPFYYRGQETRDLVTWTWCQIFVDQSRLVALDDDPALYRAARNKEPRLLVSEQGRFLDVTGKSRLMFKPSEVYQVAVGKDEDGYVQDVLVFVDNQQVSIGRRGIYYSFGITAGRGVDKNWLHNIQPGKHQIRIEVVYTQPPDPVKEPPGGEAGKQWSAVIYSYLTVDPDFIGW